MIPKAVGVPVQVEHHGPVQLGKPVWEATADDVDQVVGAMAADGLLASTRRRYVQALSSFHRFLITRRAGEIEALFGVRLTNPIDEFNASRHVGDDSPRLLHLRA